MASIPGCVHEICLIVVCSILQVAFTQEKGTDGTSAKNLSCVVKSNSFNSSNSMNCTWEAGKEASNDTQYHLFLKYNTGGEIECPHYINDKVRRHIGCYFVNVVVNEDKVILTVNGSSGESSIPPLVCKFVLYEHEKLGPPRNITVNCQEHSSYCIVKWKAPPSSLNVKESCFRYQIQDEIRDTIEDLPERVSYKNYSKDGRYRLRIRTHGNNYCSLPDAVGEWSAPIEFGSDLSLFPTTSLLLVVLGPIVVTLILVWVCKRSHAWKKLNIPVPQPKDILKQYEENMEKPCTDQLSATVQSENIALVEEITVSKEP